MRIYIHFIDFYWTAIWEAEFQRLISHVFNPKNDLIKIANIQKFLNVLFTLCSQMFVYYVPSKQFTLRNSSISKTSEKLKIPKFQNPSPKCPNQRVLKGTKEVLNFYASKRVLKIDEIDIFFYFFLQINQILEPFQGVKDFRPHDPGTIGTCFLLLFDK